MTAVASGEPEPRYRFAEPVNDCWLPTAMPTYSPALLAASQAWLRETRDDTVPLSTINLKGRAA